MPHAPDLTDIALDGRYELHELIGEGTFGRVYRGRDRRLARWVAVKVIKPWWAEDPEWVSAFEREAQLLASISDPAIVQIHDVGLAPEGLYYVAELVDGESLAGRLRHGPLAASEVRHIGGQLARALGRAHAQRVVHRDIKPANVLIGRDGCVKLGDFGVARLAEGSTDGGASTIVGTPQYMAPEQARGGITSPATDVYATGVVLYEMLAGRPPFVGTSAVELALRHVHDPPPPLPSHTPRSLARIVYRALAKAPTERYADGGELAQALEAARLSDTPGGGAAESRAGESPAPGGATATLVRPAIRPTVTRGGAQATRVGATRRLGHPSASSAASHARRRGTPRTRVGSPLSPRRTVNPRARRQLAGAVALVALVAGGMIAAILLLAPGRTRVPNLHGLTRAAVLSDAGRSHLRAAFATSYSAAPAGRAIAQSPRPGTRVSDGSTVRVTLSGGPAPVSVPRLVGAWSHDAEAILGGLKLRANVSEVAALGSKVGAVTKQSPAAGAPLPPGSAVRIWVAQPPQLRALTTLTSDGSGTSVPFRIRGRRWQIDYAMSYDGTCALVFVCQGPTATVTDLSTGATVDQFDLSDGGEQTRIVHSGADIYQVSVSPGSDTTAWKIHVLDYY